MNPSRTVFLVSDHTGLTTEMMGHSLLTQFEGIALKHITLPYTDTPDKARQAAARIREAAVADGARPIVFSTLAVPELREIIAASGALFLDLFEMFIEPLKTELGIAPAHAIGRSHTPGSGYAARMDAVNYALDHDDGGITRDLPRADIVLIGVSRCGKTPTSLYLALQFGVHAANYPLVPEDFGSGGLPNVLQPLHGKLHGLTIRPERLHEIRIERAPDSAYASLENCRLEVKQAENLMRRFDIPFLDITSMSVEEIATTLVHQRNLRRH